MADVMVGSPKKTFRTELRAPAVLYGLLLVAFWYAAQYFNMPARIGGHMPSSFTAFALILAPYWFFGFGLAEALGRCLTTAVLRVLAPAALAIAYVVFSLPRHQFCLTYLVAWIAIPILTAVLVESIPK